MAKTLLKNVLTDREEAAARRGVERLQRDLRGEVHLELEWDQLSEEDRCELVSQFADLRANVRHIEASLGALTAHLRRPSLKLQRGKLLQELRLIVNAAKDAEGLCGKLPIR